MCQGKRYGFGFTLVEILMVVVILSVLATVIIPRFTGYVDRGVEASTKSNLQTLRSSVQTYYAMHNNTWPASNLSSLLTTNGGTLAKIPNEAITNQSKVVNVLDGTGGWLYEPTTHDVGVNLNGNDSTGSPYSGY
ncbi:MAG: type II secretion system protein [Candidatus Wallbacteria bacterium]|nr:type II secretion system protein [Candidatus Wallbacteria bacterium]